MKAVASVTGGEGDKRSSSRHGAKQKGSMEDKPVYVDAAPLAALFQVRSALHLETILRSCSKSNLP